MARTDARAARERNLGKGSHLTTTVSLPNITSSKVQQSDYDPRGVRSEPAEAGGDDLPDALALALISPSKVSPCAAVYQKQPIKRKRSVACDNGSEAFTGKSASTGKSVAVFDDRLHLPVDCLATHPSAARYWPAQVEEFDPLRNSSKCYLVTYGDDNSQRWRSRADFVTALEDSDAFCTVPLGETTVVESLNALQLHDALNSLRPRLKEMVRGRYPSNKVQHAAFCRAAPRMRQHMAAEADLTGCAAERASTVMDFCTGFLHEAIQASDLEDALMSTDHADRTCYATAVLAPTVLELLNIPNEEALVSEEEILAAHAQARQEMLSSPLMIAARVLNTRAMMNAARNVV